MIESVYAGGFVLFAAAFTLVAYAANDGKPTASDAYAVLLIALLWPAAFLWIAAMLLTRRN